MLCSCGDTCRPQAQNLPTLKFSMGAFTLMQDMLPKAGGMRSFQVGKVTGKTY